jgi:sodium-dependent phosphate cotransporter
MVNKIKGSIWFKAILLIALLYLFLVSIKLMGASFKVYKDVASNLITNANNPFLGLLIGILATSIVQSSSTTTSTVVGLVGSGLIPLSLAIPLIMGANIGTSVTNTFVSMGNITREEEFKRAFSASTVHDIFNFMCVLIFFPIEYYTGFLTTAAESAADIFLSFGGVKSTNYLKVILKPALNFFKMITMKNGIAMLVLSLVLMFFSLKYLSELLKSVFLDKLSHLFDRVMFRNAAISFIVGAVLTVLVQSSSVTTSLVVPLAGAGILTLEQIFPYTLGSNLGTTITAILASLATGSPAAIAVAFAHLIFNTLGSVVIYPVKFIPISLSRGLANLAVKNKLIPVAYITFAFFVIPFAFMYFTSN